jgi:hypothetical protein
MELNVTDKSKIKIACIGNMNNTMFCITRYLRDEGYDAELLLVEEFARFSCEADSYNKDYVHFVKQLDWYQIDHWNISKKKIREDLKGYNFIIGSDLVPAFLYKAGITLDIFVPHGGDIYYHTAYKSKGILLKKHEIGAKYRAYHQRAGMKKATHTIYDYINDELLKFENRYIPLSKRLFSPSPHIYYKQYYTPEYNELKSKTLYYSKMKELRSKYDFIIMNHNRIIWTNPEYSVHLKGTDILIKGFSEFIKVSKSKSVLVLFEYGWDIEATKTLIQELGVERHVFWFPISERKNIMPAIEQADLLCGNLHESAVTYGCVMEALCMKKPVMALRYDELYISRYAELYPMVNVKGVNEVKEKLLYYSANNSELQEIGKKGHAWFLKYLIDKPLQLILSQIETKFKSN